jgi:hypothetical protein
VDKEKRLRYTRRKNGRSSTMSLKPQELEPIPELTARIAQASFLKADAGDAFA